MEAKRDQLMEMRFSHSLAALREPDDKKTRSQLWAMSRAYILAMEQLKPAYRQWYKGLSDEERMQLVGRMKEKKWIYLMQEIQADQQITDRFRNNLTLKREYDHIQFLCDKAAELDLQAE